MITKSSNERHYLIGDLASLPTLSKGLESSMSHHVPDSDARRRRNDAIE